MEPNKQGDKSFLKTSKGKVFISLLSLIFIGAAVFGAMVLYYTYQIKYGSKEVKQELAQKYGNQSVSTVGNKELQTKTIDQDLSKIIKEHNPTKGNPDAEVTIVAFMDFQCPFCQKEYPILKQVMEKYGPAINVVFKHFPIEQLHPQATTASLAATCAQEQGKFWPYYNKIYTEQKFNRKSYVKFAQDLSLNKTKFESCYDSQKYFDRVRADIKDGVKVGVRGTPTFIINDKLIPGVISKEQWGKLILDEIN